MERAAEPGFRLASAPRGSALPRTRLHGTGLLPPGETWPRSASGRDLAFVAGVDLGELRPTLDGAELLLPAAGWLLFYVDLEDQRPGRDDDIDTTFVGQPTPNVDGSDARVFFVPADTDPIEADPPPMRAGKRSWPEQRRMPRHELTLPDDHEAPDRFGLATFEVGQYEELMATLRHGNGSGGANRDDWVLGAATGVQGMPVEPGTALLLHLSTVEFQDGGAIQFRIPLEALAARDWSQAYAVADSC